MATAASSPELQTTPAKSIAPFDLYLLGVLLVAVVIAQQALNDGVTSDGCLYFAYLRSLVFDRDVQIGPELQFLRLPPRPHVVVPIGPAIVWAPFYGLVAVVDWLGATVGLCAGCAHGHRVLSARGSEFWLCRRAAKDAAFVRYPRLPVLRCPGYEQEAREP